MPQGAAKNMHFMVVINSSKGQIAWESEQPQIKPHSVGSPRQTPPLW